MAFSLPMSSVKLDAFDGDLIRLEVESESIVYSLIFLMYSVCLCHCLCFLIFLVSESLLCLSCSSSVCSCSV